MQVVSGLSNMMVGKSSVPTSSGTMGPIQSTSGLVGANGQVDFTKLASFGSTLASASMSYFGGRAESQIASMEAQSQAESLQLASNEQKIQARQEELSAKQSGIEILQRLKKNISSSQLAFSGNGVSGSSGSGFALAEQSIKNAGDDLQVSRGEANMRILQRRRLALDYARQRSLVLAQSNSNSGLSKGLSTVSDYLERQAQRG